MSVQITETSDGIIFEVRITTRAASAAIAGEYEGAVKVRVSSPPVDGAANAELIRLISKKLGVAKSAVVILSGETSRTKRLRVTGAKAQTLRDVLTG
jgi:uncharacterized protein (TIGR00251 family)